MRYVHWGVVLFVAFSIGGLQGCNRNNNETRGAGAPALPPGDGNLYVANGGTGSLLAFDQAQTAEGDLSPDRHFPETIAGLIGLFLDETTDTLYVANTGENAILIYENASALKPPAGLASATRVLSGPKTRLRRPNAVAYDATRQRLYISNEGNSSIVVFQPGCSGATRLNGDITPCQIISGASTLLASPGALALDPERDLLYISNRGANAILVYENASQPSTQGDLPPTRTISLSQPPAGLFIDSARDRLYVARSGGDGQAAILVYDDASTRSGQTSADRILTGPNTLLVSPAGIDVDTALDQIYIVNNDHSASGDSALLIFASPFTACTDTVCDLAPNRIITGHQTGLADPSGLAVDPELEQIYVANSSANTILSFGMEGNITPVKIHVGDKTKLEQPISFFYDGDLDRLYVANSSSTIFSPATPPITVYDNISAASPSNIAPSWTISGGGLSAPTGVFIHKDFLLVLDSSRLQIYGLSDFNPPLGTNTTFPLPRATYASIGSGLSQPRTMAVDSLKEEVYVLSRGNRSIRVYDLNNPSNDAPPKRIISYLSEMLDPRGLIFDPQRDILYLTDMSSHTVFAFDGASKSPPDRVRVLSSSVILAEGDRLNTPLSLSLNVAKDRLFIVNIGTDAIFIFDHASALDGEVQPDRKIEGSNTALAFPGDNLDIGLGTTGALWIDTTRGEERLFLGEPLDPSCTLPRQQCLRGALLLFSVEGNIAPGQIWSGGENRLVGPSALAVDPIRDLLYAADPGDPAITSDDSISLFTHASRSDGNIPLTGTLAVTEGTSVVIGTGTAFKTELTPGDQIKIGGTSLMVSTIYSDTSLTLVSPNPEATAFDLIGLRLPRTLCGPAGANCAGPDTKLNNPAGLAVDYDRNRLYVSNAGTDCSNTATPCNAILVFHVAGNLSNNAVPDQILTSAALNSPRGLALNLEKKTLYVANHGGHSVLVFKKVEGLNGSVRPDVEIAGGETRIIEPIGVAIDWARDILYVLNEGSSEILVFEEASSKNGNSPPTRTLSAGNAYQNPSALFLDVEGDLLYVADKGENEVYIFRNASQAAGEVSHETIAGPNTGLNQPTALAVDTAR